MCGFIGILQPDGEVFQEIYDGLICVQHRGQDAAGMVTYEKGRYHLKKGFGLVRDVFSEKNLRRLKGRAGLGHVRYPTVGRGTEEDAQPFIISHPFGVAMVHNGNVTNCTELREELRRGHRYIGSENDVEVLLNVFGEELEKRVQRGSHAAPDDVFSAVEAVFQRVKGSYSAVALIAEHGMLFFRDPCGIRPMAFGRRVERNGVAYATASENVALDFMGFSDIEDVPPGEAIFVSLDGEVDRRRLVQTPHRPCIFEYVYFARPDSFLDKVSVYKTRLRLGEELASRWRETGLRVDVVIPVPDSAGPAAMAMANRLGVPYREGFVKNRYIGRTFIMPDQGSRRRSVRQKLNTIPLEFEGKDVLLVDDSIVRGNTSRTLVQMAREAGARKVYMASYSAPLRFPCIYGIDMSTKGEFIARDHSIEEIRREIGADHLIYQRIDEMEAAAAAGNPEIESFCKACFDGDYPTQDVTPEMLRSIEAERLGSQRRQLSGIQD